MFDYHTHSHISFDADPNATASALCEQALRIGLTELAITNHYELDAIVRGELPPTDLQTEEEELLAARAQYAGKLTLLRGIELGQPCFDPEKAKQLLAERPYDIVLGSLHALPDGRDFYYVDCSQYTDTELRALWEIYLNGLLQIAKEAPVDVLTHICYPLRYFPASRREAISGLQARAKEQYEPIFRALIETDKALEINTSCIRSAGFSEPDPGTELLSFYRELGGTQITIGSDAHRPSDLACNRKEAAELALRAGFTTLTRFCERKKYPVNLMEVYS